MTRDEFEAAAAEMAANFGREWCKRVAEIVWQEFGKLSLYQWRDLVGYVNRTREHAPRLASILGAAQAKGIGRPQETPDQQERRVWKREWDEEERIRRLGRDRVTRGDVNPAEMTAIRREAEAAYRKDGAVDLVRRERLVEDRMAFLAGGGSVKFDEGVCAHGANPEDTKADQCTAEDWLAFYAKARKPPRWEGALEPVVARSEPTDEVLPPVAEDEVGF